MIDKVGNESYLLHDKVGRINVSSIPIQVLAFGVDHDHGAGDMCSPQEHKPIITSPVEPPDKIPIVTPPPNAEVGKPEGAAVTRGEATGSDEAADKPDDKTCGICGRKFNSPQAVRGHQRMHRRVGFGDVDWKCVRCNIHFESSGHYECHDAASHSPRFKCRRCLTEVFTAPQLVFHILEHKGYEAVRKAVYELVERQS